MQAVVQTIRDLVEIPSPTGFTVQALTYVENRFKEEGITYKKLEKGALLAMLPGESSRIRLLTAHVDTLGAMVKEILPTGRLSLSQLGGYAWTAIEGENCLVHKMDGQTISGTIVFHHSSVHTSRVTNTEERSAANIEVRLDIRSTTAEETRVAGIEVGDVVTFDPRFVHTETGFVKSRHLDDKASVALLLELVKKWKTLMLPHPVQILISNYEEVGFGGNAGFSEEVAEYIAVDMGALGEGQHSDEYTVSICAKDGSGPYDLALRHQFTRLAQQHAIPYKVDIYPYYSSDASAAVHAGHDVRHGLLGPGIESSHSYERTHETSLQATYDLLDAFVKEPMNDENTL
ncbi:M42 family metallopeptidase [Exiguobacterium sp. 17-1]|uniref:M42 family metallopeptidase n=1 Tax=Exiguobacterium sp. 17-1 TaxID=2931981 RepID=UPI002000535C|nr:M42 family metallopeptidase [Exiguobacterium sp. 17-1]MCK2157962.1 M42 family metallopeptidase [Exiguobacterium sp. 17-1]